MGSNITFYNIYVVFKEGKLNYLTFCTENLVDISVGKMYIK